MLSLLRFVSVCIKYLLFLPVIFYSTCVLEYDNDKSKKSFELFKGNYQHSRNRTDEMSNMKISDSKIYINLVPLGPNDIESPTDTCYTLTMEFDFVSAKTKNLFKTDVKIDANVKDVASQCDPSWSIYESYQREFSTYIYITKQNDSLLMLIADPYESKDNMGLIGTFEGKELIYPREWKVKFSADSLYHYYYYLNDERMRLDPPSSRDYSAGCSDYSAAENLERLKGFVDLNEFDFYETSYFDDDGKFKYCTMYILEDNILYQFFPYFDFFLTDE